MSDAKIKTSQLPLEASPDPSTSAVLALANGLTVRVLLTDLTSSITTLTWSHITAVPTTLAGYGITDAAALSHTHAFSTLTSKPTTVSGYGITDAVPTGRTVNGHALTADVTVTASDLGLGSVENTAISTWAGSTAVTTLGTIATGVWHGTAIADSYIVSAASWNAKQAPITTGTTGQYFRGDLSLATFNAAALGLGSVENTALSTWVGSTNVTTLGTIATGTWHGAAIGDTYISSAATWNAKQAGSAVLTALSANSGSVNFSGLTITFPSAGIPNAALANSAITIAGAPVSLGDGFTLTQILDEHSGGVDGTVLIRWGGNWQRLAPGSDGYVFVYRTSTGPGWEAFP